MAKKRVILSGARSISSGSKFFAVNFGMGVVSGLVMAYQFGTNWSGFSPVCRQYHRAFINL